MNDEQKQYQCSSCPGGMKFDCEDYTPRQKGVLSNVCIWFNGVVELADCRGRISTLEVVRDDEASKPPRATGH